VAEKCLQEVHARQPLPPKLMNDLTHGLQLAEVLFSHLIPLVRLGKGEATGEDGEQCVSVISQVEPLLPPSNHRLGHVKIRSDAMPRLDMDNNDWLNC
jgi:hypothetical protein